MIFCCPACGSALEREDRALRCANGHSYDIARQGYVHLLPVKQMHQSATQIVNARAQAAQLQAVRHLLTQEELDIVQRARNAHIGHHAPQTATPEEYLTATGFEALMGYLFLTGQMNRAQMLFRLGRGYKKIQKF